MKIETFDHSDEKTWHDQKRQRQRHPKGANLWQYSVHNTTLHPKSALKICGIWAKLDKSVRIWLKFQILTDFSKSVRIWLKFHIFFNWWKDVVVFEPNSKFHSPQKDVFARIFSSKIMLLFSEPNWIRFGIFSGLKYCFLFPNRIQFGSENFIEFFKICFPNRIGIGSETDTV